MNDHNQEEAKMLKDDVRNQENTGSCETKYQNDSWKHRTQGMICATCMWFVYKTPQPENQYKRLDDGRGSLGRCRRHSPTMNGYPAAFSQDWCGDHKLDENKI